jgi:hypothetical protein
MPRCPWRREAAAWAATDRTPCRGWWRGQCAGGYLRVMNGATWRLLARTHRAVVVALGVAVALGMASANAGASAAWKSCSLRQGNIAAHAAGVLNALDSDEALRHDFVGARPSVIYHRPSTSLCGDFDGDGVTDRAVHYQCCTVSAPAPWVVLSHRASRWRIVFRRLHDTTFKLEADGLNLMTTEPKYAPSDALCCPSQLRVGILRWTGTSFRRTFRIEDA